MKSKRTKLISLIMALVMVMNILIPSVVSADEIKQTTNSIVRVGVYSDKDAIYTNLQVPLQENDTAYNVLERVLGDKLDAEDGKYGKFIKGIGGVYGTDTSYWTYFINRESAPVGADQYVLKPNDEMIWHYTLDYGKDVTNTFEKFDKYIEDNSTTDTVKNPVINANDITINMFDSFNPLYQVTVVDHNGNDLTNNIKVVKNDVYTSKAGNYTVEYEVTDSNGLKATKTITVTVIEVFNNIDLSSEISNTSKFILNDLKNPSYGDEWKVIALSRGEVSVPKNFYETYYNNLVNTLKEKNGVLHRSKYSEYSRVIITLTALGYDPTNVGGYNLVEKLYDFDNVSKQGLNGVIYALIALDTKDFKIEGNKNSRDMLIKNILNSQLQDGGFSLSGNASQEDITAMAIQALAKYKDREDVKKCLDKAVEFLSNSQTTTGGFGSNNNESVESNAQVLIALNELGISSSDSRFIKNGKTVLDAIMAFKLESGGFKHLLNQTKADSVATEQALLALVSQYRLENNKTSLYSMTDVKNNQAPQLSVPGQGNNNTQDNNTQVPNENNSNNENIQNNNPQTSDLSIMPFVIISTIALCLVVVINKRKVN